MSDPDHDIHHPGPEADHKPYDREEEDDPPNDPVRQAPAGAPASALDHAPHLVREDVRFQFLAMFRLHCGRAPCAMGEQ